MNDGYQEILVKRQKTAKDTLLRGLVIGVIAVLIAGGIFLFNPIFLIAGMILGFLAYYFILPNFDLEYEYLYVGGDIDIDKIMAKRKRKRVASYSKDNLEVMAPTGSDHLADYLKDKKRSCPSWLFSLLSIVSSLTFLSGQGLKMMKKITLKHYRIVGGLREVMKVI